MKETKIEIPTGCEVEKTEIVDGALMVTFKQKESQLPKSWKEFCKMYPIKDGECYISSIGTIKEYIYHKDIRREIKDRNMLPDRATADAVLALCQLIQLRNCYNGNWVPDWNNPKENKWTIVFYQNKTDVDIGNNLSHILCFKSKELRDEFLRYFRPLIEKLRPLYGIAL